MSFRIGYDRPSEQDWNPDLPEYDENLPNKYDLLPGEVESLTLLNNNRSRQETLDPAMSIDHAKGILKEIFPRPRMAEKP